MKFTACIAAAMMALLHVNAQELEFAVDVVPDTITISQLIASPDVPVTVAQLEVNPPAIVTDDNGEYLGVFTEFYDGIPDDLASLFNLEGIPVPVPADSPETPPPADSPETIATNVRRQAEEHASVERRQAAPTCPGTTKLYTWSPDFVSYPAAMRGAWGYYIPNYPVNGPSSSRFPAASQIRFERRDTNININMLSSTDASGEVPGWRTSFSPVARTFNNWYDKIFVEWNFRLLVPCTGIYTFQMVADDGMALYLNGTTSVLESWKDQAAYTLTSGPINLTAGSVLPARVILYENGGHVVGILRWKLPGSLTFDIIAQNFYIPQQSPRVVIVTNNVISFNSTTGVEEFYVQLSDKPTGTVTVTINNAATSDIFGFDVCKLVFTDANWNISQVVHAAKLPGAKRTLAASSSATLVSLEPTSDTAGKRYSPATLQVVNPAVTGGSLYLCTGWGDPHYTTFDGVHFNFYQRGTFMLARDYPGNFAVMTSLSQCDPTASVTCTTNVYIKYKNTLFAAYMNQGNGDSDWMDPLPYTSLVRGGSDGVVVDFAAANAVRLTIPGGIEVVLKVGFYKTWLPKIRDSWRYFNVEVRVDDRWKNKVTGMCGTFNGVADDVTDTTVLNNTWTVGNLPAIIGGTALNALNAPVIPVPPVAFSYTTNATLDKFTFDPMCSDVEIPPVPGTPPVSTGGDPGTILPPPPSGNFTPAPPGPVTPTPEIIAACQSIIKSDATCTVAAAVVTAQQQACQADMMLAGGTVPSAAQLAILASAFRTLCEVKQDNGDATACSACNAFQACVNRTCITTSIQCGGTCVGGVCNTATGRCDCLVGFKGDFCQIGPPVCRVPLDLGLMVVGESCTAGSYLNVGQSCTVKCENGASSAGGTTAYTCGSTGAMSAVASLTCSKPSTCTAEAGNTYVCERGFQSIANQTCLLPYGCNEGSCCESRTVGAGPSTNYDNTGTCWKRLRIMLTHGDACTLEHTVTLPNIGVYCAVQYSGADCPLGPDPVANMDSTSSIAVTINAENFCDGQRSMVIDGVIFLKSYQTYKTFTRNSNAPAQNNYFWDDDVYYMLAIDTVKSLKVFNMNIVAFRTRLGTQGAYLQPSYATAVSIPEATSKGIYRGNAMGFDVQTQTHVMRMKLNSNLVENAQGQGMIQQNGISGALDVQEVVVGAQLIFTVDYETKSTRRRRRQANTDDIPQGPLAQGQAAVNADVTYVPDGPAASPSSATSVAVSSWLVLAMALLAMFAA